MRHVQAKGGSWGATYESRLACRFFGGVGNRVFMVSCPPFFVHVYGACLRGSQLYFHQSAGGLEKKNEKRTCLPVRNFLFTTCLLGLNKKNGFIPYLVVFNRKKKN